MTNKEQFKKYLIAYRDRMDFVHYMGGCGGEWLMCSISNLSSQYKSVNMDNHINSSVNRWEYTSGLDDPFGGFWLSVSKKSRNHNIRYTLDSLCDEFISMYSDIDQKVILERIYKTFNDTERVLVRSHSVFNGFNDVFNADKTLSVTIVPENPEWYRYVRLLTVIKIMTLSFKPGPSLDKFISSSWRLATRVNSNIINQDLYYDRIQSILDSPNDTVYSFSIIAMVDPEALFTDGYEKSLEKTLAIDPLVLNNINYFWANIPTGMKLLTNYNRSKIYKNIQARGKLKTVIGNNIENNLGMNDIINTDKIPKLFDIDEKKYSSLMQEWHDKNLLLISDLEDELNLVLFDYECIN